MNNKTRTLRGLVQVFRTLITNLRTNDEFDLGDTSPVDRSTNWDSLPDCSALTVFSLNGANAPSIRHLSPTGFVVTFPADVGGDIQIYLTGHILAVRKVGSPAGWAYLGLDDNQKIYMDDDTADVLRDITKGFQVHDYVTTDSDQEIGGQKEFDVMPLFNGDRFITHSEFGRLTSYVRNNFHTFRQLHQDIIDNSNDIELLSNDYHDVFDTLNNYVKKTDLSNYAPLSQLNYYATKQELSKYATTDDFQHMQAQLEDISNKAQHPVEDDLARVKDTIHKMNERAEHINKVSQDATQSVNDSVNNINQVKQTVNGWLSQINPSQIKTTLQNINTQLGSNSNQVNSLASEVNGLSSGVSTNASRLNSADTRFYQLNQHNKKADHRYDTAIKSLAQNHQANPSTPINNASFASLSGSTSTDEANEKIDVQSLSNRINSLANQKAESKVNSAVTSAQSVEGSLSTANQSLSNALVQTSSSTSSIEDQLISALSKHEL